MKGISKREKIDKFDYTKVKKFHSPMDTIRTVETVFTIIKKKILMYN